MYSENRNDYNREERQNVSWWGSRHGRHSGSSSGIRRGRRITLIDLILLAVAAGVLVPWFLSMDRGRDMGPYSVVLEVKERRDIYHVKIEFRLAEDRTADEGTTVGWKLLDGHGNTVFEDRDLPPAPGESRIFRYAGEIEKTYSLEIHGGTDILSVNPLE